MDGANEAILSKQLKKLMRIKINSCAVAACIICIFLCGFPHFIYATEHKITGIYSTLSFNEEGGDLLGEEIFLVFTNKGYQATIQIAEGGVSQLMLVDVAIDNNRIAFEIKNGIYTGKFTGTIENEIIIGKLKYIDGDEESLIVPKKQYSYWQ